MRRYGQCYPFARPSLGAHICPALRRKNLLCEMKAEGAASWHPARWKLYDPLTCAYRWGNEVKAVAKPILPTQPIAGEEAERLMTALQEPVSQAAMAREIELAKRLLAEMTAPKAARVSGSGRALPHESGSTRSPKVERVGHDA